ncbi:polysaccharide deacetylase family protein [Rheinheimera sp. MMS21-TC3]|uniref:polysaccharide deacetylase family protein n=1 Tax=Rheinheimera sp. MMS21-TC3 TaxID=3072790 RepID=UPI0028C480EC|nr:polysaccharide deacetylase family protein [Rheinheimera sp. MMS21-TC3]WNO61688.1 polysaccharide deacetylase family protein [Rheinheimera sp. MMS21-TC3]
MNGFIISLDFELFWGVRDSRGEEYFTVLKNVHQVVPKLLQLFNKYNVACTWAGVGALCANDYDSFVNNTPKLLPSYKDTKYSPFHDLDYLSSLDPKLLFAPDLVTAITNTPNQEFASHTYSHFYCLEQGQIITEFTADLKACTDIVAAKQISLRSLVFPRNQFNSDYLTVCKQQGLIAYRGNPEHWAYKAESRNERSAIKRLFRLIDTYIPLSGSLRQQVKLDKASGMVDVPASLFFRPYSSKLRFLDGIKLRRLKWSMTRTAKKGGVFHLWWHPHNFGQYTEQNLQQLELLLQHYQMLNKRYGFKSVTMQQAATQFLAGKACGT